MVNLLLAEMLNCSIDDAIIAKYLSRYIPVELHGLIAEAKLNITNFTYDNAKNDPRPKVLVLGKWKHATTGSPLICGINLRYLTDEQIDALKQALPQILTKDSVKAKYWEGRTLVPDIFKVAYRTYDERFIKNVKLQEFDIPDSIPEPKQQDIEPFVNPSPSEMPTRKASTPPPPDDATSIDSSAPLDLPGTGVGLDAKPPAQPVAPPAPPAPPAPASEPQATPEPQKPIEKSAASETPEKSPEELLKAVNDKAESNKNLDHKSSNSEIRDKLIDHGPTPTGEPEEVHDEVAKLRELESVERDHDQVADNEAEALETLAKHNNQINDIDSYIKSISFQPDEDETPVKPGNVDVWYGDQKHRMESFDAELDAILEEFIPTPRGTWHNSDEYIRMHSPTNFFKYQPELGTTVLECTTGVNFLGIYHKPTNKKIIDLVTSHLDMLHEANWNYEDVVLCSGQSVLAESL